MRQHDLLPATTRLIRDRPIEIFTESQMSNENETPCHLGALAPELLDSIFWEIDSVCALGNFVTTARFVNLRFELQKRTIIFRVLQNELGPVLTDARFLFLFPYTDPADQGYYDWIHIMAEVYRDMLGINRKEEPGGRVRADAVPSLGELTKLCHTLHEINFLANTYIAAQLHSFGGEGVTYPMIPTTAPPSCVERLRVLRAFYRRQIVSNAYAPTSRPTQTWVDDDSVAISNTSDHRGLRLGLFAAFEPWELQQIDHVNHFLTRLCSALRIAGEEALAKSSPEWLEGETRPINSSGFGVIFSYATELVWYMRKHPDLVDAALRGLLPLPVPGGSDNPPCIPRNIIVDFVQPYSLLCLTYAWQQDRFQNLPDPVRDKLEEEGAAIEFVADAVDLAPFGWVDALDGRYVNWFGEGLDSVPSLRPGNEDMFRQRFINGELWRGAGFSLWDKSRVEAIKRLDWLKSVRTGWIMH